MNFYYANYKVENKMFGKWGAPIGTIQQRGIFVVIAENLDIAISKINHLVFQNSDEKSRVVLTDNIRICNGLDIDESGRYVCLM